MADHRKQIETMHKLGFSQEEIEDVLKCDEAIDKGARMDFDLSPEEEKALKKLITVERKKPEKPVKRTRKVNNVLLDMVSCMADALKAQGAQVEITRPEHEIVFYLNNVKYKVVLSATRS